MHAVELFIPVSDPQGTPFPPSTFARIRTELLEKFGGVTAYLQAPATGLWKDAKDDAPVRDDIVIFEVMVPRLNAKWWAEYRRELCARLRQEELVVRATAVRRL